MSIQISPIGRFPQTTRRDFLTSGALATLGLCPLVQALGQTQESVSLESSAKAGYEAASKLIREVPKIFLDPKNVYQIKKVPSIVDELSMLVKLNPNNELIGKAFEIQRFLKEKNISLKHETAIAKADNKEFFITHIQEDIAKSPIEVITACINELAWVALFKEIIELTVEGVKIIPSKLKIKSLNKGLTALEELQNNKDLQAQLIKNYSLPANTFDDLENIIKRQKELIEKASSAFYQQELAEKIQKKLNPVLKIAPKFLPELTEVTQKPNIKLQVVSAKDIYKAITDLSNQNPQHGLIKLQAQFYNSIKQFTTFKEFTFVVHKDGINTFTTALQNDTLDSFPETFQAYMNEAGFIVEVEKKISETGAININLLEVKLSCLKTTLQALEALQKDEETKSQIDVPSTDWEKLEGVISNQKKIIKSLEALSSKSPTGTSKFFLANASSYSSILD